MTDYDWVGDRGDQWLTQLTGLEAMMEQIDAPLIAALDLNSSQSKTEPQRIADIGCGGGGTTLKLAIAAGQNSVVDGFDISSALVEFANSNAAKLDSRARFQVANLQAAEPPIEGYDFLLSRFGTMFFDKPDIAFSNIRRWLAPSGRFAYAVWGNPKLNPWMMSLKQIASRFVEVPKPEHDSPGPFRYADVDLLLNTLNSAGFKQVEVSEWNGQLPIGGGLAPIEAATFALNAFAFGELLLEAGETTFNQAKKELVKNYKLHTNEGEVFMDAYVYIVYGRV